MTPGGALAPEHADVFNRYLEVVLPEGADEVVREFVKNEVARVFLRADGGEYVRPGYLAKSIKNYIDKLREDLRKIEEGETDGDSLVVDRIVDGKEAFFSSIVEVREFFGETVEVVAAGKSYHVFKVCAGENKGAILFVRERNGKFSVSAMDVHRACRMMGHIRDSYEEEWEGLRETSNDINKIISRVRKEWKKVRDSEELDEIIEQLCGIVGSMEYVLDEDKTIMREQIRNCLTFKDSTEKFNPGSKLARLVSARNHIWERIRKGERILRRFGSDEKELQRIVLKQTLVLIKGLYGKVEEFEDILDLKKEINEVDEEEIVNKLEELMNLCISLDVSPYFQMGERIRKKMEGVIEVLESEERNNAEKRRRCREDFVEIYLISKIFKLENDLTRLRMEMGGNGTVKMKSFARRMAVLHKNFRNKSLAPDVKFSSGINVFFGEVYKVLNEVRKTAEMSVGRNVPIADRKRSILEARAEINRKLQDLLLNLFPKIYEGFMEERISLSHLGNCS